ncbi:MAG: peptidoglycan DD-metalloendopeptidase family protein [Rhodospirillaceae bacterium]
MTKQLPTPLRRRILRSAQGRLLPDRQIILRTGAHVRYVSVSRYVQAISLLLLLALGAGAVHVTVSYFSHDRSLSVKEEELAVRESAYRALKQELEQARRQFGDVTDSLEKNHKGLVELIGQNRTLKASLGALREEVARSEERRDRAESEKAELAARVAALESRLERSDERNRTLSQDLRASGAKLASALQDKSVAHEHGMSLSERLGELQQRLAVLRDSQASLVGRVAETSNAEIRRLSGVLETTGIAVESFLEEQGLPVVGTGGPFEAAARDGSEPAGDDTFDVAVLKAGNMLDRLEGLQRIVRALPLAAPLDYYHVSSDYGVRADPINGKSAMHRGIDFGAKYRAPILAPAPGTVTFAGWRGNFGRFVEIDHGNGIVTWYGHLRRITVKRGEKVEFRTMIGQMGNSGRSTGTHLHYEIHVNGKSVDPLKFLKAGNNVFKG